MLGFETCRYFQGLKVVAWLDHLKRKDDDRCLGCWQLMAHAGRGRGESDLPICWWMFAHTTGDDRMLLVLVMGCCWLVGVAHKKEKRGGCLCCERESREEAAENFVDSVFFFIFYLTCLQETE